VDEHCRLLVSDLGVNYLGHNTLGRLTTMGNIEGTSYWAAPELALVANSNTLRERPGPNVDVYSFAFLCFMVSFI
jgi:serine/threonine protein kinase